MAISRLKRLLKAGRDLIASRILKRNADHHDFRPILAEIEERPPNPLGSLFLWTILIFMVLAITGLFVVKVDVVVTARGKVIPVGDVKVIQPLETGVVVGIHVKEGDYVKKDSVILEIDPSIDKAELIGKDRNLKLSALAMQRIDALLKNRHFSPPSGKYEQEIIKAQREHFQALREVYDSTLREKEKQWRETQTELNTIREEIKSLENILAVVREEEKRQQSLVEIGALADNRYRETMKEWLNLERELETKKGNAEQTTTKLARLGDEITTFKSTFREKLLSEYSTSMQGKNTLEADVSNLKFKQEKRYLLAPVSGYINQLQTKTIGGVVTTAQTIANIVPENMPLQVKAILSNKDIGFAREGQKVIIKVDTYDFQKYGTIEGEVQTISPFSIDEKQTASPDPNSLKESEKEIEAQNTGYPVFVKLHSEVLETKNEKFNIKPGMSVTAEINVGQRRVIEFFLFPVIRYLDEGLKVR